MKANQNDVNEYVSIVIDKLTSRLLENERHIERLYELLNDHDNDLRRQAVEIENLNYRLRAEEEWRQSQ